MDVQKEISLRNAISYCIENNDANTATNRIMEFIRDEKEAINFIRCCKSDSELLTSFAEYLKERDILTTKKENIPVRVDLFLKRG